MPAVFLTARWIHLAMLNFEIDPAVLVGRVPAGTQLDDFQGRTYVSLVGFRFLNTRVYGVPIPGHVNFDEVNLRFYVRRETHDELRRGVVFIKEIVPRRAIAWLARKLYNENYVALPLRHEDRVVGHPHPQVTYHWMLDGERQHLHVAAVEEPSVPEQASLASFIAEHYWGYVRQLNGKTLEYQVEHPPWRVWPGQRWGFQADVANLYGPEFVDALGRPASSAFLAEGSPVRVRRGRLLE